MASAKNGLVLCVSCLWHDITEPSHAEEQNYKQKEDQNYSTRRHEENRERKNWLQLNQRQCRQEDQQKQEPKEDSRQLQLQLRRWHYDVVSWEYKECGRGYDNKQRVDENEEEEP